MSRKGQQRHERKYTAKQQALSKSVKRDQWFAARTVKELPTKDLRLIDKVTR